MAKREGESFPYVSPRWEETNFRRARPISRSFPEGPGLRHSDSNSYRHETKPRQQMVSPSYITMGLTEESSIKENQRAQL